MKKDRMISLANYTVLALAPKFRLPYIHIPEDLNFVLKKDLVDDGSFLPKYRDYIKCIKSLSDVQKIECQHYLIILKLCLYLEQYEINCEMKKHTLFNYEITKFLGNEIIINVPTLSIENSIIMPDDNVTFFTIESKKKYKGRVVNVNGKEIVVEPYFKLQCTKGRKFNITFQSQHWPLRCCHYALSIMNNRNWTNIMYPQVHASCADLEYDIKWINKNIEKNEEQKQAVKKVLNKTAHPVPYIIFGPPGTGKTATLVEIISQIMRQHPHQNILVCTTSNSAADEITTRLIENISKNLIYRMYASSKPWDSIDKKIQPHANFVDKTAIFIPREILLLKKVVITTLITSLRLITMSLREDHFSYIIIDEASQAIEPEIFIPLSITKAGDAEEITGFQTQVVIAGDPHQLGPVVRCKKIEHLLGKSMLERLMDECDPYQKLNGKYNSNYITKLVKNYRSHENLLHVSNELFYEKELESCGGPSTQIALNWSQLPNKNFPMIFQEVLGRERRTETKSVYNISEVFVVMQYVNILINTKFKKRVIKPKDIGIITPFKRQQIEIARELAKKHLNDITVGTVETFQGQERTIIILSTVRSKIFEHDGKEHIGFLSNKKRCNVALTRAKALMIIVGKPEIICMDEHWNFLWEYCKENDGYVPFEQCPLKPDMLAILRDNYEKSLDTSRNKSVATRLSIG